MSGELHASWGGQGRRPNARPAFTLVELLVVVAIIALLLTIAMPGLMRAKELTRRAVCQLNLRHLMVGTKVYAEDWDGKYPPWRQWASNPNYRNRGFAPYSTRNVYNGYFRDTRGDLVPLNLCMIWEEGHLADGRSFYCPSQPLKIYQYDSYPPPFHKTNRELPGYWRTAYLYNPHVVGYERAYPTRAEFPPRKIFAMDILHREIAVAHWQSPGEPGWCVVFGDGSADYRVSTKVLKMLRSTPYIGNSWSTFDPARDELEDVDGP